jgi:hypothetical protein
MTSGLDTIKAIMIAWSCCHADIAATLRTIRDVVP